MTERHDGAVVVRLDGELDAGTRDVLQQAVDALPGAPVLVLDLRALAFVDSLGLNLLFGEVRRAQHAGTVLRVVRAPVHVQRLLALAAMDRSLGPFYPDAESALRG